MKNKLFLIFGCIFFILCSCQENCKTQATSSAIPDIKNQYKNADVYIIANTDDYYLVITDSAVRVVSYRYRSNVAHYVCNLITEVPQNQKK